MKPRAAVSWSGGKDSYLALHRSQPAYDIVALVTMFDEHGARSRSHGLRPEIVEAQAQRLDLTLCTGVGSWATYEDGYRQALAVARAVGITHVIFGDIMYESNREFPERVSSAEGLIAVEPLWGEPTGALYHEFVQTGADARIVTLRDGVLDPTWLGRRLSTELMADLIAAGVDPCGEHGEYHSVVLDAPLFSSPIPAVSGQIICHNGCWAVDLTLARPGDILDHHAAGV
jgi:uncharacterized protein (TIGR00290 family)